MGRAIWKKNGPWPSIHLRPSTKTSVRWEVDPNRGMNNLFNKWGESNEILILKVNKTYHHTKIIYKWFPDLNMNPQTIKLLEENREKMDVNFLRTQKTQTVKKFDKLDFIKISNFCSLRDNINKVTRKPDTSTKSFQCAFPTEDRYPEHRTISSTWRPKPSKVIGTWGEQLLHKKVYAWLIGTGKRTRHHCHQRNAKEPTKQQYL